MSIALSEQMIDAYFILADREEPLTEKEKEFKDRVALKAAIVHGAGKTMPNERAQRKLLYLLEIEKLELAKG